MTPLRFDIAIIGNSLSSRMAAALLAKHGKRVFRLASPAALNPWQMSSSFTGKLLEALGSRGHSGTGAPFQVLSTHARVTFRADLPLKTELLREFGASAPTVGALLDEFERYGSALEELLWVHGGLPAGGIAGWLKWRWLCLRRKLPAGRLSAPLAPRLQGMPQPAAEWLRDLFQGLTLQPVATLSVADAALLWTQSRQPPALTAESLDELLGKRFEQFHGVDVPLDALNAIEQAQGQWICSFSGGKRFQAEHLVLGDLSLNLPGISPPSRLPAPPRPQHFTAAITQGRVSALLEKRVIAGGNLPMQLALIDTPDGPTGFISAGSGAEPADVHRQLEPILPFARYAIEPHRNSAAAVPAAGTQSACTIFNCPLHFAHHGWLADETRLLPQLGSGGAALVAWTLVRRLDPAITFHGS